jgi:Aromatic-ring-opening dioxygenase LigAB, LigA subunit
MSKHALEQVLMRALGDGEFRDHLKTSPEATLARYELTDEERKAILDADQTALLEFGVDKRLVQMLPPSIYKV